MADIELPEITEVQRMRLEPGDKVAVYVPVAISMAAAHEIKEKAAAVLGLDEDSVLVLGSGITLGVVSQP